MPSDQSTPKRRTARAVIYKDGKLLVMERWRRDASGTMLHYYSIPGGGIEPGETPEQAVVRELQEEMCVAIAPERFLFTDTTHDLYQHSYYWCRFISGEPRLDPASEEAKNTSQRFEPRWVDVDAITEQSIHGVYAPLLRYLPYVIASGGIMPKAS